MAVTEVILKENVPGLGAEADMVKVRRGFARNYLVPQGKAYEVTPANLKRLNLLKGKRAEREARELNEAEELARKINRVKLEFILETGETGKAFGSVTAKDIEDKLQAEAGIAVDRHRIRPRATHQGIRRARSPDSSARRCHRDFKARNQGAHSCAEGTRAGQGQQIQNP